MLNWKKCLFSLLLALIWVPAQAKEARVFIKFAEYLNQNREPYLEMYFAMEAQSLDWREVSEKTGFRGGMKVTVEVYRTGTDSNLVAGNRFRLLSPVVADTGAVQGSYQHEERFLLDTGQYRLVIEMEDITDPQERYRFTPQLSITRTKQQAALSEIMLLNDYRPAAPGEARARSGYVMTPRLQQNGYFYPASTDTLSFYAEFFNTDLLLDSSAQRFLAKYYLENAVEGHTLKQYSGFGLKNTQPVVPLLASWPITELPTGGYNLVVEAIGPDGDTLLRRKTYFVRQGKPQSDSLLAAPSLSEVALSAQFDRALKNTEPVSQYIKYLYPISDKNERKFQQGLLDGANTQKMRKYLFAFWQSKKPEDPLQAWEKYLEKVRYVNQKYPSRLRPGYRTDRGRVYLTYGEPSQVQERPLEPQMPPYEIWHYEQINSPYVINQNNRIFIFGEMETSTNEYQLVHSTAVSEQHSRDWQQELLERSYGGSGGIDPNDYTRRRSFGSRAYQNMLIQSTNSGRSYR